METDTVFAGPIPQLYDRHLGPILFQPYALAMAERLGHTDRDILETAAGTGIVTRAIMAALPHSTIIATDLNQAMLDVAAANAPDGQVTWQQADAQSLPFGSDSFDAVVEYADAHGVNNRIAAYMLALDRVLYAIRLRGIYA